MKVGKLQEVSILTLLMSFRNSGVGYAKNKACRQSHGKFLCFLDSDDIMKPNRVKMQYEAALATGDEGSNAFIGSKFVREPEGSTARYTKWACELSKEELRKQVE